MEKKDWRREMKRRIASMTEEDRNLQAETLFEKIERMPEFVNARRILLYWSLPDEPSSHALMERWKEKKLILPSVVGSEIELRRYRSADDMKVGSFHINEPIGPAFMEYDLLDMAIIPGLSFDSLGYRLGRGKGYYDRLLPKLRCLTVGVCFPCQYEAVLPHDEWDIPVKCVIC